MRRTFVDVLCQLAAEDDRIALITGDLGYMALEPFRDRFPERFLNAGVAEQNMLGVATGLAEAGFRPYVYSIAPFASLRPFEFIRNGPVAHRLPVRIVGMGMGFDYGHSGFTHYAVEDIGSLRTLLGLTIVVPADSAQAAAALRDTRDVPGPVYYSLSKDQSDPLPPLHGRFALGEVQRVREGRDVALVAMGGISLEVVAAAEELSSRGVEAAVLVVSNFSPDPANSLAAALAGVRQAVTVEEQTSSGGLGAFAASVIACHGLQCRLEMIAVAAPPDGTSGKRAERWRKHGLDRSAIVRRALEALGR